MKLKQIFIAAMMLLATGSMMAQQMPQIPVDKNVRIGHLDNGLTYYIRHNNFPEHVASFYIAQKVGSINENDDQRGLAHLLEHLAFNGSEHFQGNSLQNYLQSIGVEYGKNLNAYTSIDKTVYYFTDVPTTRATAVDSCMLILKDWSNGISLTKEAIEGERDVVHNEYRMRMVGQQRMLERSLPALYPGSKYGYRMPIGLMSIIDGCDPETLRAYYRKWYRPDNQAIIIVGDVDVDHIEAQIKKLFSGIKVPANAAKVIPETVPDNNTPIYVIDKDKEQNFDLALVSMKHEATPDSLKGGIDYLASSYVKSALSSMLNARYAEKALESDCPFLQAGCDDSEYLVSRTKDAFNINVVAKPGKMLEAYGAALREAKRAKDFGFTATEYLRFKDDFLSGLDKIYSNRDKMKNEQFTTQYVDNFIANEPIPSVEDEYQIYKMMVPNLPVDVVNAYAKKLICETDTNFVTLVMMRDVEGGVYPTQEQLANVVKQVRGEKLEAYVDNVKQEPLMAQLPKTGKIKKTTENKQFGFKLLTLSNGAKVVLKKTDYKNDEVQFVASALGGSSAFDKKDYREVKMMPSLMNASGLGNFSNHDLEKALAGKIASCGFSLSKYRHGLGGSSTPKDLETLMQLIYLNLTNISKDEKNVANLIATQANALDNQSNNPQAVFQDSLSSTMYHGEKFYRSMTSAEVKSVNYDRALELGNQLYGNAKDYTFYFVGNFDEKQILPMIEQYIASLPSNGKQFKNKETLPVKGEVVNKFTKAMENPQDIAAEIWCSEAPYTLKNSVLSDIVGRLVGMDYNRNIRETLSAAYYAGADGMASLRMDGKTMLVGLVGNAMMNPDKSKDAIPCFYSGLKTAMENPNVEDLQKVKEILLKQADVSVKQNGYWMGVISQYLTYGMDTHTDYKKTVSAVDANAVKDFLKNVVMKDGNHIEVIMHATKAGENK